MQVNANLTVEQEQKLQDLIAGLRAAGHGTNRSDMVRIALAVLTTETAIAYCMAEARKLLEKDAHKAPAYPPPR